MIPWKKAIITLTPAEISSGNLSATVLRMAIRKSKIELTIVGI